MHKPSIFLGSSTVLDAPPAIEHVVLCWNGQRVHRLPSSVSLLLWSRRVNRAERLRPYTLHRYVEQIEAVSAYTDVTSVLLGTPINLAAYHTIEALDDDPTLIARVSREIQPDMLEIKKRYPSIEIGSPYLYPTYPIQMQMGSWAELFMSTYCDHITVDMRWDESQVRGLVDPDTQEPGSPWWWLPLTRYYPIRIVKLGRAFASGTRDELRYRKELAFVFGVLESYPMVKSATIFGYGLPQHPNWDIQGTMVLP